ncbi:InlB B-repeat-containing protein, partial [Streptosporangium fragile]|uniref:InlB B-repeat-containing protein n=1 Tax=Streptosporangium fragile TaxID=46186 RepID=UPI0031E6E6B4
MVGLTTMLASSLVVPLPALAASGPASPPDAKAAAVAPTVKITDLGSLVGKGGTVIDINNKGEVLWATGDSSRETPRPQAKLYSDGEVRDLHALLGLDANTDSSTPYDIREDGTVLVRVENASTDKVVLIKGNKITPVGKWAITGNDRGQLAGIAFVLNPDDGELKLQAFKGQYLEPSAMDNSGSVVGRADMDPGPPNTFRAFKTMPGEPLNLERDELKVPGTSQWTRANDVNEKGLVAGHVDGHPTADVGDNPVIWDRNAKAHIQDTPYGGRVEAINEAGIAVGVMYTNENMVNEHAALFRDGVGTDLNTLLPPDSGWVLKKATGITDGKIRIIGVGRPAGADVDHGFLLELGSGPVINSVTLETKKYPSEEWSAATEVYDGAPARVAVSLTNPDPLRVTAHLKLAHSPNPGDLALGSLFPMEPLGVELDPNETRTVWVNWKTDGIAWEKNGDKWAANWARYVKARLYVDDVKLDFAESAQVITKPRPVVLVHGWKTDVTSWAYTPAILKRIHPHLEVGAVGDGRFGPDGGTLNTGSLLDPLAKTYTLAQNAKELTRYAENMRRETGSPHLDLIGHSMGGLIARQMIQDEMPNLPSPTDGKPVVIRMLQMGTPNRGTPCADLLVLLAHLNNVPVPYYPATAQVTKSYVHGDFYRDYKNLRGVIPSNLAGVGRIGCYLPGEDPEMHKGDLIVPLWSARFYLDIPRTGTVHMSMTDSEWDLATYLTPRLASVPDSTASPDTPGLTEGVTGNPAPDTKARATATDDDGAENRADEMTMFAASSTQVGPGAKKIVSLDVPQGTAFGVTGVLPPTVGLLLLDPAGKPAAQYTAGSDAAKQPIQGLSVATPQAGAWKLEITNTAAEPVTADLGAWVAGNPATVTATAKQSEDNRVTVTATVTDNGQPVTGRPVLAFVTGEDNTRTELSLQDDGDGVYSATTEALADGVYSIVVKAETDKGLRTALDVVEVKKPDTREFTLKLSAGPGGSVTASPAQEKYRAGTEVKVTATPEAGRVPIGWVVDGQKRGPGALTLTMDQDHTVEARFGTYTVTEIGALPGGNASRTEAETLNDRGQVAATVVDKDGKRRAVRWQDGTFTELGGLTCTDGAVKCEAGGLGLNEAGEVSGWAVTSVNGVNSRRAVVWRDGGLVTDLQPGNSASDFNAVAVNDNGQTLGYAGASPLSRGVMWDRGTAVTLPPDYAGGGLSYENEWGQGRLPRINRNGAVAGGYALSRNTDGSVRDTGPMFYADGVLTKLPGTVEGCATTGGRASDLNSTGLVVGTLRCGRYEGTETKRAYVWKDGKPTDLGVGEATAVNDNEVVVGSEQGDRLNAQKPPLMWVDGQKYQLANVLSRPWCPKDTRQTTQPCVGIGEVLDLNSSGQILVRGFVRDRSASSAGFVQEPRSFLLTPTPARTDLEVTHSVSATEPGPGSTVTWTATVTN